MSAEDLAAAALGATKKNTVQLAKIATDMVSIPRANRIAFIGDSNTDGRLNSRPSTEVVLPTWAGMASVMSEQRLYFGRNAAISGYTTKSAFNTQVDQVISDNPAKCIVMLGTNDIGLPTPGVTFPTESMSFITQIADKLVSAKIEPIFMTVYPITLGSTLGGAVVVDVHNKVNKFNQLLTSFCSSKGYQLIDTYSLMVIPSTGDMNSLSNDGVHTGTLLAHNVAEYVCQQVTPKLPSWNPYLSESSTDPTNLLSNGLFITDADADGVPDGWAKTGTTLVTRIDPGVGVFGKWATFYAIAYQSTETKLTQNIASGFSIGDKVAIGGKIDTKVDNEPGSIYSCKIYFNGATVPMYSPLHEFRTTIEGTFHQEYTFPPGTTSITVEIGVASGTGTFKFGQLTLRNLTVLGVA